MINEDASKHKQKTRYSNLNTKISIQIKEIQKNIFWPGASLGGGAKFIFSLLLEIEPSNLPLLSPFTLKFYGEKTLLNCFVTIYCGIALNF